MISGFFERVIDPYFPRTSTSRVVRKRPKYSAAVKSEAKVGRALAMCRGPSSTHCFGIEAPRDTRADVRDFATGTQF